MNGMVLDIMHPLPVLAVGMLCAAPDVLHRIDDVRWQRSEARQKFRLPV